MKKITLLFMTIMLSGIFSSINAQQSDEALSAKYKQEISILESEIKIVKIKLKTDKTNTDLQLELLNKQNEVKDLKSKKKVVDNSIKSKKAAQKADTKAKKAAQKAERAASEAEALKQSENQ